MKKRGPLADPQSDHGQLKRRRTATGGRPDVRDPLLLALLAGLVATGVGLAFRQAGAYSPEAWLPVAFAWAALALILLQLGPGIPAGARQWAVLGLFVLLAAWSGLSILWADSRANAWEETNRILLYFVACLAAWLLVAWLGRQGVRRLPALLFAAIAVFGLGGLIRLLTITDPTLMFVDGRWGFVISYWNGLSSLLTFGAWLGLALAQSRPRRRWVEPLLLVLVAALVQLGVLIESRGPFWASVVVLPWFFVVTPHRFRAAVNLALVVGATAVAWPHLAAVFDPANRMSEDPAARAAVAPLVDTALRRMAFSLVLVPLAWLPTYLVERRLAPVSLRTRQIIGAVLLAAACAAVALGVAQFGQAHGGVVKGVQDVRQQIVGRMTQSGSATRFSSLSLNGRAQPWRLAWRAFSEEPITGLGGQNFESYFLQHRETRQNLRQPHSHPLQLLAELGLPGFLLSAAFIGAILVGGLLVRFGKAPPGDQAALAALLVGVGFWLVHGNVDWIWQLAGVSWMPIVAVGGLLGAWSVYDGATAMRDTPAGSGARATRLALTAVVLLTLVSTLPPMLSHQLIAHAWPEAMAGREVALRRSDLAARLDPFSPQPALLGAAAAEAMASSQDSSPQPEPADTQLLALAVTLYREAEAREPDNWQVLYRTGRALLLLSRAREADGVVSTAGPNAGSVASWIASTGRADAVSRLMAQDPASLRDEARDFLVRAQDRNPRAEEIAETLKELPAARQ